MYSDRKPIGDFLAWCGGQGLPAKGHEELSRAMGMFGILIEVMVTRVFTFVKTHQNV